MSSITDPATESTANTAVGTTTVTSPNSKGKSKAADQPRNEDMDDAEEEAEEEEEGDDDDDEEEEEEETYEEIDPSAIVSSGRRTRGVRVDYTSKEALEKAGLKPEEADEDEDEDVVMG